MDRFGRMGNGEDGASLEPVPVVGGDRYRLLSAGYEHSCAITVTGEGQCWGSPLWGQIGAGHRRFDEHAPVPIVLGVPLRDVSAATHHSCAVSERGLAYCWGRNGAGRLGDGTLELRDAPVPVAVPETEQ